MSEFEQELRAARAQWEQAERARRNRLTPLQEQIIQGRNEMLRKFQEEVEPFKPAVDALIGDLARATWGKDGWQLSFMIDPSRPSAIWTASKGASYYNIYYNIWMSKLGARYTAFFCSNKTICF